MSFYSIKFRPTSFLLVLLTKMAFPFFMYYMHWTSRLESKSAVEVLDNQDRLKIVKENLNPKSFG